MDRTALIQNINSARTKWVKLYVDKKSNPEHTHQAWLDYHVLLKIAFDEFIELDAKYSKLQQDSFFS